MIVMCEVKDNIKPKPFVISRLDFGIPVCLRISEDGSAGIDVGIKLNTPVFNIQLDSEDLDKLMQSLRDGKAVAWNDKFSAQISGALFDGFMNARLKIKKQELIVALQNSNMSPYKIQISAKIKEDGLKCLVSELSATYKMLLLGFMLEQSHFTKDYLCNPDKCELSAVFKLYRHVCIKIIVDILKKYYMLEITIHGVSIKFDINWKTNDYKKMITIKKTSAKTDVLQQLERAWV